MNDHEWPRAVTGARQPPVYQNGRRCEREVEIQASKGQKIIWQGCKSSTRVRVRARSKGRRYVASWYVCRETFRPLIVQVIRDTVRRNTRSLRPKNDSKTATKKVMDPTVTTANTPAPKTDQSGEQPVKVATPVQVSSDRLRRTYRTRTIETLRWH